MLKVFVTKQGPYPIKAPKIKSFLREFFKREGIVSDAHVSVALVDKKKMLALAKKYYKDSKLHSVFSFVEGETVSFVNPKGVGINLGEIVICYSKAVSDASKEGKLVEKKVLELVEHAGQHLMGRHHL